MTTDIKQEGQAQPATPSRPFAAVLDPIGKLLQVRVLERRHAGYFFLFYMLIGMGLAIGRGTSDALFFKRYGIEFLPLVYMAHAGVLFVATLAYAAVADRFAAERLFRGLFGILMISLLASWMLMAVSEATFVYPLYYLLYEITSDLLVLHVGVYIAQNFETQQAKRLTPLIFAGAQFGSIGGGLVLVLSVEPLGVSNLIGIWVALVLAGFGLMTHHHRRYGVSPFFRPGRRGQPGAGRLLAQIGQGLAFARRSALMRWSSLALFFTVFTFYIVSYSVNRIYTSAFVTENALAAFFGWLTVATGVTALLLQLLVTSRLLRRIGVRGVNLIFPATTVASLALLLTTFTVPVALFASINKDAMMKAFRNPARSLLFNALPGNMQGRARAVATGLVLPLALALTGGFLAMYTKQASPTVFLIVGLCAAMLYLLCNLQANRAYARGILQILRDRLFVGSSRVDEVLQAAGPDALEIVRRGVNHEHDDIAFTAAKLMADHYPQQAPTVILDRLSSASIDNRDRFVRLLWPLDSPPLRARLRDELAGADDHLRGTIYEWLIHVQDQTVRADIGQLLVSANPRLMSLGVYGVQQYSLASLERQAMDCLATLLHAEAAETLVAGLSQLARSPDRRHETDLLRLLAHEHVRVRLAALEVLAVWPVQQLPGIEGILRWRCRDPQPAIRRAAVRAFHLLPEHERSERCRAALEDKDMVVRDLAAAECMAGSNRMVEALAAWLQTGQSSPRSCASVLSHLLKLRPPRTVLEEVAHSLTAQAHEYVHARAHLRNGLRTTTCNQTAHQILLMVLVERTHHLVDLALTAIGAADDPEGTRLIRAGLRSHDRRHIASAREALRHISNSELANSLDGVLELVEQDSNPGSADASNTLTQELLESLSCVSDPWLRECVERVLGLTKTEAA